MNLNEIYEEESKHLVKKMRDGSGKFVAACVHQDECVVPVAIQSTTSAPPKHLLHMKEPQLWSLETCSFEFPSLCPHRWHIQLHRAKLNAIVLCMSVAHHERFNAKLLNNTHTIYQRLEFLFVIQLFMSFHNTILKKVF